MVAGRDWSVCARGRDMEMLPSSGAFEAVSGTAATLDLTAFGGANDLRNRWVWFGAVGAAVTLRRFTGSEPSLTAGTEFTIASGARERIFIAANGYTNLRVIASGAGSLVAEWSPD